MIQMTPQRVPLLSREPVRKSRPPPEPAQLFCNIVFHPTEQGGRRSVIRGDLHKWFSCFCKPFPDDAVAWDAKFLLEGEVICPGDRRRLGVRFLEAGAVLVFAELERFYLWEGRVIGVAENISC